jgi:hypothetical protein
MWSMDRRGFLIHTARASVLLILPAGWATEGCGGDSSPASATGAAGGPGGAATGLRFTSDTMAGHTHDFTIAMADFAEPPPAGLSGETTVTLAHTHTVSLTADELSQIEAGRAVSQQTTIVDGHQHTFKFSLSTAQSAAPTPVVTPTNGAASAEDAGADQN